VGQIGLEEMHGLYWLVTGGGLKDIGADWTIGNAWFVLVSGWWWVVE
jgi:hypothetical protein